MTIFLNFIDQTILCRLIDNESKLNYSVKDMFYVDTLVAAPLNIKSSYYKFVHQISSFHILPQLACLRLLYLN